MTFTDCFLNLNRIKTLLDSIRPSVSSSQYNLKVRTLSMRLPVDGQVQWEKNVDVMDLSVTWKRRVTQSLRKSRTWCRMMIASCSVQFVLLNLKYRHRILIEWESQIFCVKAEQDDEIRIASDEEKKFRGFRNLENTSRTCSDTTLRRWILEITKTSELVITTLVVADWNRDDDWILAWIKVTWVILILSRDDCPFRAGLVRQGRDRRSWFDFVSSDPVFRADLIAYMHNDGRPALL